MDQHTQFPAKIDLLRSMIQWIRQRLHFLGFEDLSIRHVELAAEEALVNVIRHGYESREGTIDIGLHFLSKDQVEIKIIDQGPPFNPLEIEIALNPFTPLEERAEGGLGILFMKQYMDEIHYERSLDKNVLTLIKRQPT